MARTLPNNQEAEQALLSTMFISKYVLDKAIDSIDEEDFYYDNNRIIYHTIKILHEKGIPIDMPSVLTELKNSNKLNEAGGMGYITEVLGSEAVATNSDYYIKKIQDT